jgi:lysophospholipase L1-like esterase
VDIRRSLHHRRGPVRQAHPVPGHHRLVDSATLLVGLVLLGAVTIGTVVGAGGTDPGAGPADGAWNSFAVAPAGRVAEPSPGARTRTTAPAAAATEGPGAVGAEPAPASTGGVAAASTGPGVASAPAGSAGAGRGPQASHAGPVITDHATAVPSWTVPRPVAAFVGDSYTTGWAGAGTGSRGWPAIVGAAHGWRVVNRAVAGTGFVNPGWTGQPVRTRLASVVQARPGIVFVAAGHNDNRFGRRATGEAADAVLRRLRRALPDAVIVVIGPIWANGSPPASIRGIRAELRASAASIGARFVDPIRDGWFAGAAERFILDDGIHPSNAGHRRIAAFVLAALEGIR